MIKFVGETTKSETKKKVGFLLLGMVIANLLGNMLAGKGTTATRAGKRNKKKWLKFD